MSNFKGSTGTWWVSKGELMHGIHGKVGKMFRQKESPDDIYEENIKLVTDAGNVRQKIDFDLPELLEQRNELLEVLSLIMKTENITNHCYDDIKKLINKFTGV